MAVRKADSGPTASGDDALHRLISGMTDGTLSDAEFAELSARLANDPAARAAWFLRNDIERGLVHAVPAVTQPTRSERSRPTSRPADLPAVGIRGASLSRRGIVAAATTACLMIAAVWLATRGPVAPPPLARVTDAQFVVAGGSTAPPRPGDALDAGTVRLGAGLLQITLRNGVVIALQGPASLDLIDDTKAFLGGGSAVVKVPKGMSGFRLDTATTQVLDLGTEFAVRAGDGTATDVQVYDGAVIASRTDGGGLPTRLEAGEAARFSTLEADPQRIRFVPGRFVRNASVSPAIEDHRFAAADEAVRMYGRPQVAAIRVSRPGGPVTIDGRLDDWPAPGFASSVPGRPAATHGVEGSMRYDDEHLYIAAHIADPSPLRNQYDPELDAHIAWQGGGLQVRFSADRQMGWPVDANSPEYYLARRTSPGEAERAKSQNPKLSHLTLWHHAPSGQACIAINHATTYSGPLVNPPGVVGAFALDADGRGYTLEYAIPWRLLNAADDPPRAGDVLGTIWQAFWADPSGMLWREQMIEVRNPDEPARLMPHERAACWGRAEFQ